MFPTTYPQWKLARCFALALLIGVLISPPTPLGAAHDGTCHPAPAPAPPQNKLWVATVMPGAFPRQLLLRAAFEPDGSTRVFGVIHGADDARRQLLRVRGAGQSSCADSDVDGTPGLTQLATDFQDIKTGERVRFVLTPTEHDIDASGVYRVTIQLGEETVTSDARVRVDRNQLGRGRPRSR